MHKEFQQIIKKKRQYGPLGAKDLNMYFLRDVMQINYQHTKTCSTSFIIMEMQFRPQLSTNINQSQWLN